MNAPEPTGEPITAAGIEDLKAELAELEGPARQEMAARIKTAREEGDLKENAEYHVAKEGPGAHGRRGSSGCRNGSTTPSWSRVDAGQRRPLRLRPQREVLDEAKGETNVWTLVGSTEANLAEGRLSAESPIGRALMNAKVGARVNVDTPRGRKPSKSS